MKVLSTEGLTKLIDLIKSSFISNTDTETVNTVTLATVATTGAYSDLSGMPTVDQTYDGTSANAQSGVAVASAISTMLSTLYPVGSIYIGTQSTCPLAALISGSTWVKVSEGRVLQGSDSNHNAGTTIAAGLPNITGTVGTYAVVSGTGSHSGALNSTFSANATAIQTSGTAGRDISIDASSSSSVYGNSTTVQPPAYVVNIWERTA